MAAGLRKGYLIALGGAGILVALVLVGLVWVVYQTRDMIEAFVAELEVPAALLARAEALNQEYPFVEPDSGAVTAERLRAFLRIKRRLAPRAKAILLHLEAKSAVWNRQEGLLPDLRPIAGKIDTIRQAWLDLLAEEQMSPEEYRYLHGLTYDQFEEPASGRPSPFLRYFGRKLRRGPPLTDASRAVLEHHRDDIEAGQTYGMELYGFWDER